MIGFETGTFGFGGGVFDFGGCFFVVLLVEAMGGEVHFYSLGEGLGSTVTFTVPLYQQPVLSSTEMQDC